MSNNNWRAPISGDSDADHVAGVTGVSSRYNGVLGVTTANGHAGVAGVSDSPRNPGNGVYGRSKLANGVIGFSSAKGSAGVAGANDDGEGNGVYGRSKRNDGVAGITQASGKAGVLGFSEHRTGNGVYGVTTGGYGVFGQATDGGIGVYGYCDMNYGVMARSTRSAALYAEIINGGGGTALSLNTTGIGYLIFATSTAGEVFKVSNTGATEGKSWSNLSDKNAKENFSDVNTLQILDKLASMPIQSWNYKDDPSSERHIGPTAQDFHAIFGLNGDNDTHISSTDLHGVALAAIQGLNEKNQKLETENANLQEELSNLAARLSVLESKSST